jgi:hypothetical protein
VITARSVKAVLDNLREDELDLPFTVCECHWNPDTLVDAFLTVTKERIMLHRDRDG